MARHMTILAGVLFCFLFPHPAKSQAADGPVTPADARVIAKEACIYGFPLVDSYRILHSYFVDRGGPEFKAPWNQIHNEARVFTPDDKAVQTPNSDTPYSQLGADLRAEPLVLTVPAVEKGRYYSLQFIDLYTHNFAYVGSRATGNEAGSYLLAGPDWKGEKPAGVRAVIRCETQFAFVLYRTQLFDVGDIENVRKIQAGYKVEPLSTFLGTPAPAAAPAIEFRPPLSPEQQRTSAEFFEVLDFVLRFCPTHPSERELRDRLAKLGVGAGKFDVAALPDETRSAVAKGMADAWEVFAEFKRTQVDTGKRTAADGFGTREYLKNDYLGRMSSAVLGIYGNSKEEALYPIYFTDAQGAKLDASRNRYTLRFPPGALPPVNAFWSLTMYELPSSLLVDNPLDRYLINSPMLPNLKRDADGGLTVYVQHESPGEGKDTNWLPAPDGEFFAVLRLYWPKEEALTGVWKAPPLEHIGARASSGVAGRSEAAVAAGELRHLRPLANTPDAWHFQVVPYVWAVSMDGESGPAGSVTSVDSRFRDVLQDSDSLIGMMLHAEAAKGRWAILGDITYARVGVDEIPTEAGDVDARSSMLWFELAAAYRLVDRAPVGSSAVFTLDALAGGRLTSIGLELNVPGPGNDVDESETWAEPFVGARARVDLGERWALSARGDVGGFGVGSDFAWQAVGTVAYRFHIRSLPAEAHVGYRALGQDYDQDGFVWDVVAHGPVIGFAISF